MEISENKSYKPRLYCGFSDRGQVMNQIGERHHALASVEREGTYEHLAIGHLEEGYTLAYRIGSSDYVKYDVFSAGKGINPISSMVCKDNDDEYVKVTECKTDDDMILIRQIFTFPKNSTRVLIQMILTNCSRKAYDFEDLLIKRFADIDVDTGGSKGWADYKAYWDKTRFSAFTYNLEGEAGGGRHSHVVNMIALPSDLPLDDVFLGYHGDKPYLLRPNTIPVDKYPTKRMDADAVLQWRARRFLTGETLRINMCYDCYQSFYQ